VKAGGKAMDIDSRDAVLMVWPDVFRIVEIDRKKTSWITSGDLTESQARAEWQKRGHTEKEAADRIVQARNNPV
jgi:hypothetical protein